MNLPNKFHRDRYYSFCKTSLASKFGEKQFKISSKCPQKLQMYIWYWIFIDILYWCFARDHKHRGLQWLTDQQQKCLSCRANFEFHMKKLGYNIKVMHHLPKTHSSLMTVSEITLPILLQCICKIFWRARKSMN